LTRYFTHNICFYQVVKEEINNTMKFTLAATLIVSASAFSPIAPASTSTALFNGPHLGAGGMADTRDPDALIHEDPRKSIAEAPSFEEYLKMRSGDAPGDSMRGKYEGSVWDMAAKLDVYGEWNPAVPRSAANFSPFETWEGNSPDCSGFFPGEGRYKDPARPDVSYAIMQAERVILDEMTANPKPGFTPGCPGCRT
jgi:hypothetical protein